MKRLYDEIIKDHCENYTEMLFLVGPRQVGKTTASIFVGEQQDHLYYFNWDDEEDRVKILAGSNRIAEEVGLTIKGRKRKPIVIFDEIHKYKKWRQFLKGFYDRYGRLASIIATGSARLDFFRRSGDSLMGRYLPIRMHPLSVGEILHPSMNNEDIRKESAEIGEKAWGHLIEIGGFPKPFVEGSLQFYQRWKRLRQQLLFKEDIRDLTQVQEIAQMEILAEFIRVNAGSLVGYASLAKMIRVSADTIRRWTKILRSLYYHFELRPWSKNITRSLIKEPKYFLWDWASVDDPGHRFENMIASHLLKAVHFWTDLGFGDYSLHFIRNKDKQEVDFIMTKNKKPWILVEAKISSNEALSPNLKKFQAMINAPHAFQVAWDMDYEDINCFDYTSPVIIPAKTFLSQLV